MEVAPDPEVELVRGNASARVRSLKSASGRGIYLCGGSQLAAGLWNDDLIDEVVVKVNPVVLGAGVPLVAAGIQRGKLALVGQRTFDSGVVFLRYRVEHSN
jgi:dihydrofolate reductase